MYEKQDVRQKNIQHDHMRRDQFAQTWQKKEAAYQERQYKGWCKARNNQHKRAQDIIDVKEKRNAKQEQVKQMQRAETERVIAEKEAKMHDRAEKRRARDAELLHWK